MKNVYLKKQMINNRKLSSEYFAAKENWRHPISGAVYQLNTQTALTWLQAETSCQQQGASLLSITDPHQQAYVTGKMTQIQPYID